MAVLLHDLIESRQPVSDSGKLGFIAHGESEQYHSEIKTDMDVERLPSGKFESNKLALELTVIVYNILRIIGQESLKKRDDLERKKVCLQIQGNSVPNCEFQII